LPPDPERGGGGVSWQDVADAAVGDYGPAPAGVDPYEGLVIPPPQVPPDEFATGPLLAATGLPGSDSVGVVGQVSGRDWADGDGLSGPALVESGCAAGFWGRAGSA
jgi:hypothetical protein